MMDIELPKMPQSQQDMDLIDILWRQDIDLGAGREVFDYNHRQKEHELQRQRELEEEARQQRLREQEKALLAELQLDEETGEFVPRTSPVSQAGTGVTPPEATQSEIFTEVSFSFDECMQLLEQTFPLEAIESAPPTLDATVPSVSDGSSTLMVPHQGPLTQTTQLQAPPPMQKPLPDLEQAWMELLLLPELQQCLNMQMGDMVEPVGYANTNAPNTMEDPNYGFYMPKMTDVVTPPVEAVSPTGYQATFAASFTQIVPPENLSQLNVEGANMNPTFTDDSYIFYPEITQANTSINGCAPLPIDENGNCALVELPDDKPLKTVETQSFDGFDMDKTEITGEFPDSDSGLSLDASPNDRAQGKSVYGDRSFGFSDSDMEDMESNPGSFESDYAEALSGSFDTDNLLSPINMATTPNQPEDSKLQHKKVELAEDAGHSKPPFAKDKHKKRAESRLSRDEQRAKSLEIPFSIEVIINLPVDDFNEMMSKHQLNEAQLALVRDIRRRGKNKVAAQNCRKRKMESIAGLEYELDSLREERERLLKEKTENGSNLRQVKQRLSTLYQEVFSMLRDEEGKPYSPAEYSLQQTSDGNVFLVPRIKKTLVKSDAN